MNSIYLHEDDLVTLQQFLQAFNQSKVELVVDSSSNDVGIILTARLHSVEINGMTVTIEKVIIDEGSW